MDNINIKEELKKLGITEKTKFHNYEYLYNSVVKVVKESCDKTIILCKENFSITEETCMCQKTGEFSIEEESIDAVKKLINI